MVYVVFYNLTIISIWAMSFNIFTRNHHHHLAYGSWSSPSLSPCIWRAIVKYLTSQHIYDSSYSNQAHTYTTICHTFITVNSRVLLLFLQLLSFTHFILVRPFRSRTIDAYTSGFNRNLSTVCVCVCVCASAEFSIAIQCSLLWITLCLFIIASHTHTHTLLYIFSFSSTTNTFHSVILRPMVEPLIC